MLSFSSSLQNAAQLYPPPVAQAVVLVTIINIPFLCIQSKLSLLLKYANLFLSLFHKEDIKAVSICLFFAQKEGVLHSRKISRFATPLINLRSLIYK
jgi:hypothetical protein